ncbi:YtzI protein [Paucisalibacillus sp. EB02]|uniref:YtzI protein n=1 Tax=Paucisalibacillus sp. EB02 TaxID=1347087 RepID=UPI0004BC6E6D|nr:YtzI protein [Paucisalibacillus sp. EB02]
MIWIVAVICIVITVIVVFLSILTLDKGYGYKHTVDPLPSDVEEEKEDINGDSTSRPTQ